MVAHSSMNWCIATYTLVKCRCGKCEEASLRRTTYPEILAIPLYGIAIAVCLKKVNSTNTTSHHMLVIGTITIVTAIQPIVCQSSREEVIIV